MISRDSAVPSSLQTTPSGPFRTDCSLFQDFLGILSKVSRGSVQEKLQWIFGLYDLNGDGLITKNEMLDVVTSIYEMLGRSTEPVVEEHSAKEHVEKIFHVSWEIDLTFLTIRRTITRVKFVCYAAVC
jgi:Ca2+-binding EF-hand superfamily protein